MQIQYNSRLVAFIDVLGFKNIVYSASTDLINTYYRFLLSNFQEAVKKRNFEFLLISDSIVIYCSDEAESLTELIKLISILQAGLLGKQIIVRGAISHGELFVDKANNIIVGRGLINAFNLEAQAKFPRVIVDRSIVSKYFGTFIQMVEKNRVNGLPHIETRPLNFCPLDYPYLNYGRILATYVSNKPFEAALNLIRENYYRNDQIEKYEWLKAHIIQSLKDQHEYLKALPELNKNEKSRLRRVSKYVLDFEAL